MLKGNKGEWSEIYVLLKLLGDKKLFAADENLEKIASVYYPILKIIRNEAGVRKEYQLNGDVKIILPDETLSIPIAEFISNAKYLFHELKRAKGRTFEFPKIEKFLHNIKITSIKAKSSKKSDISIKVHDARTSTEPTFGFSVKSLVGKDSTLFNAGKGTNFIYKISFPDEINLDLAKFNTETYGKKGKIKARLNSLEEMGAKIRFHTVQSENFLLNLQLIDCCLPEILSHALIYKYRDSISSTKDILQKLVAENPLKIDLSHGHPFYEYKVRNFLVDCALGMTAEAVWTGHYDATGGIIIVKDNGEALCYHIYNRNKFTIYLENHTRLEQPQTSEDGNNPGYAVIKSKKPFKYGWVYKEGDDFYIKLNLQIRFKDN